MMAFMFYNFHTGSANLDDDTKIITHHAGDEVHEMEH